MARNKYPEQTIDQILAVSTQLFIENGYEKTTIQQILNKLQMSKGAIYHHFKSKEDILEAVINKRASYAKEMLADLVSHTKAESAKEKLEKILFSIVSDHENHAIDVILCSQMNSPQFVVAGIQSSVYDDAAVIAELLAEGIADGSIQTEHPLECAEIFMLLLNIWSNPVLFQRNLEQTKKRLLVLQKLMRQLGADILSDELMELIISRYAHMIDFPAKSE